MSGDLATVHYPLPMENLPRGWACVAIGDVVDELQSGFASGKHNRDGTGIPHLRPMNVSPDGRLDLSDVRYIAPDRGELRLSAGDVLFNNTNSPAWVGKTAFVDRDDELAFSNHMTRLRVGPAVDARFLSLQLHFLRTSGYFKLQCKKHVNQASISRKFLSGSVPAVVPPLPEQRRIVAKTEALQERSHRARQALQAIPPLLDKFRQSVLAAGFRGDLTADWRAKHPDVEPASALLARIRAERRRRWEEAELVKLEAKGKRPKNEKWKQKYKVPAPANTADLPELPASWCWTSAEEVCEWITKGTTPSKHEMTTGSGNVPFVKVYNLTFSGDLDFTVSPTFVSQLVHGEKLRRSRCFPDDVLMNIVGPPLGKVSVVPSTFPEWNINQAIAVFRPLGGLPSRVLAYHLMRNWTTARARRSAKATAGQFNLTLAICRALPVPLMPAEEARELAARIDNCLQRSDRLAEAAVQMSERTPALDAAILTRAFSGRLVPQDPADDSAAVLLAP